MLQNIKTTEDALAYIRELARDNPMWLFVDGLINQNKQLHQELDTIHNRERKDYFTKCYTVVEVKTRYLQLAQKYNFHRGGDAKTMEHINDEYEKACDPIIMDTATEDNLHEQFAYVKGLIELVSLLQVLPGIKIEIIGTCLLVSCFVYQSEVEVREFGLRYLPSKQAWGYPL